MSAGVVVLSIMRMKVWLEAMLAIRHECSDLHYGFSNNRNFSTTELVEEVTGGRKGTRRTRVGCLGAF